MTRATIILVAGPTASGKSALALDLAHKNSGIIINTDALQIYEGLPLLSAQPGPEQLKAAPHKLYSALPPDAKSSAGIWQRLAEKEVEAALAAGKTPILVGGTGLYFRAFFGGLASIPDIPDDVRDDTSKLYDTLGENAFRARLAEIDSESAAKLARNDRQRMIRAFEVATYTGKPLAEWHKADVGENNATQKWDIQSHLLMPPRDDLYAACDARFAMMIKNGGIDEAAAFLKRNLPEDLPVMKTIGVREIGMYLNGNCTLDEAVSTAQQTTRNYAKRQMTWFRNQWKY